MNDIHEREHWKDYRKAYEECLSAMSTQNSPWYVVPADDKKDVRLIVSAIILDRMEKLKMSYSKQDKTRRKEIKAAFTMLKKQGRKSE